jgi:hypothetical protein
MLNWTEPNQLCLYLYIAKHNFSIETNTEYSNIMSDEDSDIQLAQPL